MRLWSLHPKYLDSKGLVALWREALLAQAVLRGRTRGYRNHPQLERFRRHCSPVSAVNAYLLAVHQEAVARGYVFDRAKIGVVRQVRRISVTSGQLDYERKHLLAKLRRRSPAWLARFGSLARVTPHPLFRVVPGGVADWEVVRPAPMMPKRRK